jgi:hypothetical protein
MRVALAACVALALAGCAGPGRTFPANYTLPGTVGQVLKGQTIGGQLSLSDPRLSDNSVYQAWTYIGSRGERIQVDVTSTAFDAYAIIADSSGNALVRDDDSGGGTNARVIFRVPKNGAYRIIANTYRQGSYGAYALSVRELSGGR